MHLLINAAERATNSHSLPRLYRLRVDAQCNILCVSLARSPLSLSLSLSVPLPLRMDLPLPQTCGTPSLEPSCQQVCISRIGSLADLRPSWKPSVEVNPKPYSLNEHALPPCL